MSATPTIKSTNPVTDFPALPPSLDTLPAEIITAVAEHLRSLPHRPQEYTPRIPVLCYCSEATPLALAKAQLRSLGRYQDEALAFSMVCRRLREVVFMERLDRKVTISHCEPALKKLQEIPQRLRARVRTLRIDADPSHEDTEASYYDPNQQHWQFPNLHRLIIDWRVFIHGTGGDLRIPEDIWEDSTVRELEVTVGTRSTGIKTRSRHRRGEFFKALNEAGDMFGHLHLPVLETAVVRIDSNHGIIDGRSTGDVLAEKFTLGHWGKTVRRLELTVSFDLGNDPDDDFADGLNLLETFLPRLIEHGIPVTHLTLNFFFPPRDFSWSAEAGLEHVNIGEIHFEWLIDEERMRRLAEGVAKASTLEQLEVQITGSTSNGWKHHERTLATVSLNKATEAAGASPTEKTPLDVTFVRNHEGAEELLDVIENIVRQDEEGLNGEESAERGEWMALRGMMEQSWT